jgi:glucan phosphoethanolaminetransferase (alkaline phosphatase superfamily)
VVPGLIASLSALSAHRLPGWLCADSTAAGGKFLSVQYALMNLGLSLGAVSIALALYRWPLARRLLHLFLFSILLELFYRVAYGGAVSAGVLLSVPETSRRETGELLAGHGLLTLSLALVALMAICALLASWRAGSRFSVKGCIGIAIVSMAMMLSSVALGGYELGTTKPLMSLVLDEVRAAFPVDVATALGAVAIDVGESRRLASARARFKFPNARMVGAASRGGIREIYVIVIGETSRRINWSLFGYTRPTTPRLDAIKSDLTLFNRVSSNATNTILSVPLALTRAAPASRDVALSEKSIITLLRQAGFDTYWISNQERSEAWFNPIARIALEADHVSFPDDVQRAGPVDRFDSNLLTRLNDALAGMAPDGKAVIFLHMEGSHFGYKERYPAGFSFFSGGRGDRRLLPAGELQLIDEYDNSVYFTDYNVRSVIDRLSRCGCRSGLIFFSDHGERLFDNGLGDTDFGHGFPTVSRQEIDIPFFIWLSSAYRREYPSLRQALETNAPATAELDNVFETITDLAGVTYDGREAGLSLFSARFRPPAALAVLNTNEATVSLPPLSRPPPAAPAADDPAAR